MIIQKLHNTPTDEAVEWITADPVTGSSVRLSKTGAFAEDEFTQLEAMGQEVLPVEPSLEPQPPSSANATHSAEEPEWQCKAAELGEKNFFEQPSHCQRAQMESSSFPLSELFSARMTESNPQRVGTNRQPPVLKNKSPVNLAATNKPSSEQKAAAGAVAAASIPDDESSGDIIARVDAERWEDSPIDSNNAEFSGFSDLPKTDNALKKGIDSAKEVIDKPDCAALFVGKLDYLGLGFKKPSELLEFYEKNGFISSGKEYLMFKQDKKNPKKISLIPKTFKSSVGANTYPSSSYTTPGGVKLTVQQITVNERGFFYNGRNPEGKLVSSINVGFNRLDLDQIRAAVIIHELLHVVSAIPRDDEELNDDGRQSKINSELVRKNCF